MNWQGAWDCHVHVFDPAAPRLAGHYEPSAARLEEIEALGAEHLVLVQPSVYGTDNTLLLQALRRTPARHRGVAVVDASITGEALDGLHAAGVRGVRFNRVSPVGNSDAAFHALAPRLRERGWHAQWYVQGEHLPRLVELQRASGLTFVLDHLGGTKHEAPALAELAHAGGWIKLSGFYRLQSEAPYGDVLGAIERAERLFGDRMVWGSDWPHTSLAPAASRHASLLAPVRAALGEDALQRILRDNPPRLYR